MNKKLGWIEGNVVSLFNGARKQKPWAPRNSPELRVHAKIEVRALASVKDVNMFSLMRWLISPHRLDKFAMSCCICPELLPITLLFFGFLWQGGKRWRISNNFEPMVHRMQGISHASRSTWPFWYFYQVNQIKQHPHNKLRRVPETDCPRQQLIADARIAHAKNHLTLVHLKEMDKQRLQVAPHVRRHVRLFTRRVNATPFLR